ncbi:hypothetical protein MTR67_023685 [Solanum verrucosum]|uniref:RNase H type-1 domain-containing protein n=1 Tax=Solanum verrucosum TaxID=315347 RepID=A0AAF0R093_SOLVR|nr:hypothetical protein MTR67_023685 [Solanum verrucosum]
MIRQNWRIPWALAERIEEIQRIMNSLSIQMDHVFREANQLANFIINETINQEGKLQYLSFSQLPSKARRILNMDKHQIPLE